MSNLISVNNAILKRLPRRLFHLLILVAAYLCQKAQPSAHVAWLVILCMGILETVRISLQWRLPLQRDGERYRPSSFFWTVVAFALCYLFVDNQMYWPLFLSCAIFDPLIGELRLAGCDRRLRWLLGMMVLLLIWSVAWHIHGFPLWWVWIMPVAIFFGESLVLSWLDDNAIIMLLPPILSKLF